MFLTNHSSAFLLYDVRVVKNVACLSSLLFQEKPSPEHSFSENYHGHVPPTNFSIGRANMYNTNRVKFALLPGRSN